MTLPSFPKYVVLEVLYEGQRTFVYRAVRKSDNTMVVIKVLKEEHPLAKSVAQLRHEFDIMRKIDSPFVVKVYDFETVRERGMLVMENFEGISLANHLANKAMSLENFLPIAMQIAQAIGDIHHQYIVHKDIKPHNIIISEDFKHIKVVDFGLATYLGRQIKPIVHPKILEGTIAYISPEQTGRMNVSVGYLSDIYSLGVSFYEMLSGRLPFAGRDVLEVVNAHLAQQPTPLYKLDLHIPKVISDIVDKCLSKSPDERYHSAFGLKNDLEECYRIQSNHIALSSIDFSPGKNEVYDHISIPQKLYGREVELKSLRNWFDEAQRGHRRVVFISGDIGIGKTSTALALAPFVEKFHGYFITGKCEPSNKNIPFKPIIDAFQGLIQKILVENEEELTMWRNRLLKSLGRNGQLIVEILPDIKSIIGEQPEPLEVELQEAERRFNSVFSAFVGAFLTRKSPLVLFLDDLQDSDESTLRLLNFLLTNSSHNYFMFIGAYRPKEVSAPHSLLSLVETVKKNSKDFSSLNVQPLSKASISTLIEDVFYNRIDDSDLLAEIIYHKTHGNPFFSLQFLTQIYQENLINFYTKLNRWQADFESIKRQQVTDNVADLMSAKIKKLSLKAQRVLAIAAAIGNNFDLNAIAALAHINLLEISMLFDEAFKEELIYPLGEDISKARKDVNETLGGTASIYVFQHDKIQKTAYELNTTADRKKLHLAIGRFFRRHLSKDRQPQQVIQVVSHYNNALELIDDINERKDVAELNSIAASKAQEALAYATAVGYAKAGILLLGDTCWDISYEISLFLYSTLAISAYLLGDAEAAEAAFDVAILKAQTLKEKGRLYNYKCNLYMGLGKAEPALKSALEAFKVLKIPIQYPVSSWAIYYEHLKFLMLRLRVPLSKIDRLSTNNDEYPLIISSLYKIAGHAGFQLLDNIAILTAIKSAALIWLMGINAHSSSSLLRYAMFYLLPNIEKNWRRVFQVSASAEKLADRYPHSPESLQTYVNDTVFFMPWQITYRETATRLEMLYRESHDQGLSLYAANSLLFSSLIYFYAGGNLESIKKKCMHAGEKARKMGVLATQARLMTLMEACNCLSSATENSLDPITKPVAAMLEGKQHVEHFTLFWYYSLQLFLAYLFGHLELAQSIAEKIKPYLNHFPGTLIWQFYYYYHALTIAALSSDKQKAHLLEPLLHKYHKKFKKWARITPNEFDHHYYLLSAEIANINGKDSQAVTFYIKAIETAIDNEFHQDEAIACELLAKFYWQRNKKKLANFYFQESYFAYNRWGATAKLRAMEKQYPNFYQSFSRTHPRFVAKGEKYAALAYKPKDTSLTLSTTVDAFDLTAVIDAAYAISEELVYEHLISKLMRLVMLHAGADKAYLILSENDQLHVKAEIISGWAKEAIVCDQPIHKMEHSLCVSAVYYVYRTKKTVLLDEAVSQGDYKNDPYVVSNRVQSLLVMPLERHGQLTGILYLENSLAKNIFTTRRLLVLTLLSSQIAISIDNSRFYTTMEAQVAERTKQLKYTQQQIGQKERAASMGVMIGGIAHELQAPIVSLRNASSLSFEAIKTLDTLLRNNRKKSESGYREIQDSMALLISNIEAIKEQGERAQIIISKMNEQSTDKTKEMITVDFKEFLKECLVNSYKNFQCKYPTFYLTYDLRTDSHLGEVDIFPDTLQCAIVHLLNNSYESLLRKKHLLGDSFTPNILVTVLSIKDGIEVHIKDNGMGIAKSMRAKVFTPLFTTKHAGDAGGFGLAMTYNIIVLQHGGYMTFRSEENEYAEFIFRIPLISKQQ